MIYISDTNQIARFFAKNIIAVRRIKKEGVVYNLHVKIFFFALIDPVPDL